MNDESEDLGDALLKAVAWTPAIAPFNGTNRYRVHACLGEGGFGVVYEVEDIESSRRLALKTLKPQRAGFAANIRRLKREFRVVADLVHPNLVGLHELASHDARWFFTMELVRGRTFREYLAGVSEARVRAALGQLVAGVTALHQAGIIHRDLKPSNVLVEDGGRVVILDFGLADGEQVDDPELYDAGTPSYMAPEQAAGKIVTPAADWYAVGVMLYEALAGCLPGKGAGRKLPPDLERLCTALLRDEPSERPSAAQIHAMLGARIAEVRRDDTCFVGRAQELQAMRDAYARRPALVQVRGQSGVGKSALVERFCSEIGDAIVLRGRCHEREAVPFKAFDGVIDMLVGYLKSLPRHEAAALMPRDIALVTQLFPVLDGVEAVHDVPSRAAAPADPRETRERSFAALNELIARIADKAPLVIAIDDLQWSDVDSARLLLHLLTPPRPRVLVVLAYRSEDADRSPALRETLRMLDASGERGVDVHVQPLPALEAEQLAAALGARGNAQAIAERGEGHPLFIVELARERDALAAPSLLDMLWQRVLRLSASARALVETLAVAGEPLPTGLCCAAAGVGDEALDAMRVLRAERLIRAGDGGEINVFHDRVRDAVIARADVGTRKQRHLSLARELQAMPHVDLETVARHFDAADEHEQAARYALRAADASIKSLAFDRAAALYRMAIERKPSPEAYEKLGEALLHAGSDAEAGKAFLEAASGMTGAHATTLRHRAAQHMLEVGDLETGYAAMKRALADVGEKLPATRGQSLREAMRHLIAMRLRGMRVREVDQSTISADVRLRLDVLDSAAKGLASADFALGLGVMMRFARLALKVGDPRHASRGLMFVAPTFGGPTRPPKMDEILDRAEALAASVADDNRVAFVMRARAQTHFMYGNLQHAYAIAAKTEEMIAERCVDMGECHRFVQFLKAWIDVREGRLERAWQRGHALLVASEERQDPVSARLACVGGLMQLCLTADDPDRAQRYYERVATEDRCAGLLFAADAAMWLALYRGRPADAVEVMRSRSEHIKGEGLLMPPGFRLIYVRAYATALLANGETRGVKRLLRMIRTFQFPLAMATKLTLRGLLALQQGRVAYAAEQLRAAADQYAAARFAPDAAACRYRVAQLAGDEPAMGREVASLREIGVVAPERWIAMKLPVSRRYLAHASASPS